MSARYTRIVFRFVFAMSLLGLVVPLKVACVSPEAPSDLTVGKTHNAIINGKADLTQPAIGALVVQRRSSFCTGTLITRQLVVTAAHCVDAVNRYGVQNITFRVDFPNAQGGYRSEHHTLLQVAKHPQYTQGSGASYDIAVLVLQKKVTNVTPISANQAPMDPKWVGTTVHVVGYGLIQTQPSNRSADQKYAADIPLFQIGARSFVHYDNKTAKDQRKSACHGDSGGPALYTVSGKTRVLGVTSIAYQATPSGGGQTLCDGGAVSTRTDANYDFLRPFLRKYGDGPEACKTDSECSSCDSCSAKKVCEPKTFAKEATHCGPCKTDSDCGTGVCYRFSDGFRCLQACTADSCCPGGTVCNTLGGTSKSAAVCSPEKNCGPVTCTANKDCGPGEACDKGTCKPDLPPRIPELCLACKTYSDCGKGLCYGPKDNGRCTQPCGAGDFCPDGFACQSLYAGLPKQCVPVDGTCRIPCVKDEHCASGFECQGKFCTRKGGGIHGDSCDPMVCKAGLLCVLTASGKNCMQPCGIKSGYGGTVCPASGSCLEGTRCYKTNQFNVCLGACRTTAECTKVGGGTCSQVGNCLCRSQNDCSTGYICNLFTYSGNSAVGSCVPLAGRQDCKADFECRRFNSGQFCVPKGAGARSVGENCDSLNRCKEGLSCLNTGSSLMCLEDCTNTKTCSLGGNCVQVGRTTSVCLCQGNLGCPKGRVCRTAFQGYGVCQAAPQADNRGCIDAKDCPPFYDCKQDKCVPGATPPAEPTSETAAEPTIDAGPGPESKPEPKPEPQVKPEPKPEPQVKPEPTTPKPDSASTDSIVQGGCSCQHVSTTPPADFSLGMLLLFGAFLSLRRRR